MRDRKVRDEPLKKFNHFLTHFIPREFGVMEQVLGWGFDRVMHLLCVLGYDKRLWGGYL